MRLDIHLNDIRLEDCARAGGPGLPAFADVRGHIVECPGCWDRLAEMNEFVGFMRECPEETSGKLVLHRDTEGGAVFLIVHGGDATGWEGRVIGAGHHLVRAFRRGPEALEWLEQWFQAAARAGLLVPTARTDA